MLNPTTATTKGSGRVREGVVPFSYVDVLDLVQDSLIVRDLEDRICFWNKGAERLYGWKADEVAGQDFYSILFQGNVEDLRQQAKQLARAGEWSGEFRQVTKARKVIVVESHWKILRDEFNRPTSVLIINKDITERMILEGEILRAERFETFSRLTSSVAHDLNGVLATMRISIHRLLREHAELKDKYGLESWHFSSDHAAQLVTQLVSLGRDIGEKPRSIDIGRLIHETVKVLKNTFPESIDFETVIPPDLHTVFGNATNLYQVLLNLCVNARDAMPSGGTLEIGATNVVVNSFGDRRLPTLKPGVYVLISVADTGVGIAAEIAGDIFDPFFTTKETGKGTGLGLFSVARIIKNHGGCIKLEAGRKLGTQFMIYLPAENVIHR